MFLRSFLFSSPHPLISGESSGKFFVEAWSLNFSGNVMGKCPDGATLPVSISAMLCPISCPHCHGNRIASGISFHEAVSIAPPTLSTTTTFFSALWNASATWVSSALSSASSSKSAAGRSRPSPDWRWMVTMAISLFLTASAKASGINSGATGFLCHHSSFAIFSS